MAVAIDTLKAAMRLREEGGFSKQQATSLVATFADGFVENLATKDDVAVLRGDLDHLRGDLKKAALRTDLEKTEASLRGEMEKLRGEMSKLEHRMTLRLGGAIAAAVAILVGVDKLF